MTPAEATKILDLLPHSTPEQIEARFVEQRTLLEDKAARALTPKLQAQYREALARITEAYETLVLAEEGATLPALKPDGGPAAEAPPAVSTRASGVTEAAAAAAAVDSFGPWVMRQLGGMIRGGLAVIAGTVVASAVYTAVDNHYRGTPLGLDRTQWAGLVWVLAAAGPGLAWWIYLVRSARHAALRKYQPSEMRRPERRFWPLFFALLTVAVTVIAFWYDKLDNDEAEVAQEWNHRAHSNERAGKWADAVADYGQARGLRPNHEGYRRDHDQAQQSWLDALSSQLKALPPEQAYAQLTSGAVRPRLWLTSPTREKYQKLYGQTTGRFHEAMEKDLAAVGPLVDEGKLLEARALIEKLRPVARQVPAFPAAAEQVEAAEFDLLLAPAREAESKEDYPTAYALLEKLPVKGEAAHQRLRKAVVLMHCSQFMQFWQQSGGLIQQGEFIEAQDKFIDLEVIAERIAGLDGYAEVAKDMDGLDLATMIANVRRSWRAELVRRTTAELIEALATSDAPRAQDILAGYAALQGYASPVSGEVLVKEKFFPQFLDYLAILNLRTISPGEPDSLSCLALVQAALPHFTNPEPARQFLAAGYHTSAQWGLDNGVPGLALYLQRESVRVGGATDEALETAALKLFAENNPVRIAFPEIAHEGENTTALAESLYQATKTAVDQAAQGLIVLEENGMVDEDNPRQFILKGVLTGIGTERGQKNERKTATYPTGGSRQVKNPAWLAKQQELEAVIPSYDPVLKRKFAASDELAAATRSGDTSAITRAKSNVAASERALLDLQNKQRALLKEREAIPAMIQEPVLAEQPYQQVTHHLNHAATLELKLVNGALTDGGQGLAVWPAALRYSTVDVTGDIQRGVPVQQAVFLSDPEVEARLKQDLTAKITAQTPALLWQLAQAVHTAKLIQLQRDSSQVRLPGDFEWGWVAFWEKCGVSLRTVAAEAAAREDLGLPPLSSAVEKPFVPPAGWQVENSMGMRFNALPGTKVLFSVWETRVQDFAAFINETGYAATGEMRSLTANGWASKGDTWRSPGFKQDATHPVCGVSWNDAKAFCAWLTKKERAAGQLARDLEYRLPTQVEWELAAGTMTPAADAWPQVGAGNLAGYEVRDGNTPADFKFIAGYADGFARTAPVGWFSSNPLGIYDLEGNVAEWCQTEGKPVAGDLVRVMGSSFVTAESETDGKEPRKAVAMPEMRFSGQGFRVVIAPAESK